MFFVISKILKILLLPLTWIFLLLMVGYWVKNVRWKRGMFIAAAAILLIFSDKPLLNWAQYMTTRSYSHQHLPEKYYEVAIVMGGYSRGIDTATTQISYIDERGARLWEAMRLYESGKVDKLLITGDISFQDDGNGHSTASTFRQYLSDFGIHDGDLLLDFKARNTAENAEQSISILDSLHYKPEDCLLVTSASHMRRSRDSFAKRGWEMDTYATNVYGQPRLSWMAFIPQWRVLSDWTELLNEWFGNIAYRIADK